MLNNNKISIIATILTLLLIYLVLQPENADFVMSVIPGWHTTIPSEKYQIAVYTFAFIGFFTVVFNTFRMMKWFLFRITSKSKNS